MVTILSYYVAVIFTAFFKRLFLYFRFKPISYGLTFLYGFPKFGPIPCIGSIGWKTIPHMSRLLHRIATLHHL